MVLEEIYVESHLRCQLAAAYFVINSTSISIYKYNIDLIV